MAHNLKYSVLEGRFAICQLAAAIPEWASRSGFFSITRAANELSIVCPEEHVSPGVKTELGWVCLQLQGPFPFTMTGVLATFLNALAAAEVGIFAVSTFDTDWILIKAERLSAAEEALRRAGHERIG